MKSDDNSKAAVTTAASAPAADSDVNPPPKAKEPLSHAALQGAVMELTLIVEAATATTGTGHSFAARLAALRERLG